MVDTLAVKLLDISRLYGSVRAVDHVSLDIRAGEFFTLLGSSGSGKTTTLRMIGGFERPDEGRVLINNVDVTSAPAYRRDVHTVFQDYALFPHLTVGQNVAFAPFLKGMPRAEVKTKVAEALAMVQLEGMENRKTAQMSGGQQQRVALARALVDHPSVLLLDEPLSALDAKIRSEVREELKTLQRRTGITFIYVTHDQEEALTMSDRMAVMRGGKVLQVGSPIDVYERPADLFVAQFIGKANFIEGVIRAISGQQATVAFDTLTARATVTAGVKMGAAGKVMIRPENLRLVEPAGGIFTGTIKQASYLGHATEYLIDCHRAMYRALELRRRGAVPRTEGTAVGLTWDWNEALVYPSA